MFKNIEHKPALSVIIILFVPIIGLAIGVGLSFATSLNGQPAGDLVVNSCFLLSVLSLIPIFNFTRQELGLTLKTDRIGFHISSGFAIFTGYLLFYIFVIRISSLKPIDSAIATSLLTYLIVVVAEEIYFRGQLYSFIDKRYSAAAALAVSSLLFGILHARQGLNGIITKSVTGALWGSVRSTTGMIHLLIFPVHFTYNSAWLLFEGSWSVPPVWAVYALPIGETILMLLILFIRRLQVNQEQFKLRGEKNGNH